MPEDLTDELLAWAIEQLGIDRETPTRQVAYEETETWVHIEVAIRSGITDAAEVLIPGDPERQELISELLLTGYPYEWPLIDGVHPADLVLRTAPWETLLRAVDTRPAGPRAATPALALVCAKILERLRRADKRGKAGSVWRDFTEETGIETAKPATAPEPLPLNRAVNAGTLFQLDNPQAHNLIQGQTVQVHLPQQSPPAAPPASTAPAVPLRPHNFKRGPLLLGRIPPLAAARQERPADHAVAEALADGPNAMVCQVVSGMAGTGKTQIAAAYARNRWDSSALQLMVWVNADTRTSITAAFAEAAVRVCGSDGADQERAATEFLDWLDRPTGPRWLIVLDGVTEPKHLVGLWPPESSHGRTVITTRIRSASWRGARRAVIDVGSFTPEEALAFLHQQLGQRSKRIKGADELAWEFGYLPLALAQVTAFIHSQPDLTCEDYHQMFTDETVGPADLSPGTTLDDYPESVAASIGRSIALAEQHPPQGLCLGLLKTASLLSAEGIPIEVLRSEPVLEALAAETGQTSLSTWAVNAALGRLNQLSLIDSEGGVVRIHPFTQLITFDGMDQEARGRYGRPLADALLALWPTPETDQLAAERFRECTRRLRVLAPQPLLNGRVHGLLFRLGQSYGESGQEPAAVAYFRELEEDCTRALGFEHLDVLEVRGRLIWWHGQADDAAESLVAAEELLLDKLRILGPDHEATLAARDDIAWTRGTVESAPVAVAAYEELLPDWQRVMGPDHTRTLEAREYLAGWRKDAGDPAAAAVELRELVADRVRVLGPDHAATLKARSLFAECLSEAEDATGALAAYGELLEARTRLFGGDHPVTLDSRFKHARWLGLSGDAAGAVAEYEELLQVQIRVLGPDYEDTLLARNNLAHFRGEATGDMAAAAAEFGALLVDVERVFGADHPSTRLVRNNHIANQG
jgi:hypothetical protein